MNIIITLITILFITAVGFAIIRGFNLISNKDKLLSIACSYGLGVGLISMQLYVFSRLNFPWHKELLIYPWLILVGVILFRSRNRINFKLPLFPKFTNLQIFLLCGILVACSYTIFEALIRPVTVWDGWAIWLLKSKIFFLDGTIDPEMLNYIKSDYPLIISLLGTFIYIILGRVDDTAVLITSTAFYLALALLFLSAVKKKFGFTYALLFTFLLVTTQNFVRHGGRLEAGLADLALGYYAFACFILLIIYLKTSSGKLLLLLNIFLGITTLIKFEGVTITLLLSCFMFYHITKNRLYSHFIFFLIWFIPFTDWQTYKKIHLASVNYFTAHKFEFSISKTLNVFSGTFKELINVKSWNMLWIIYFYTLFIFKITKNKELMILNTIILFQFAVYIIIYIFTSGNSPESSIERLLIHIAPLALYSVAILFNNNQPEKSR